MPDRASLTSLLRFNSIPDPWCIYQGLHKLPPATLLTLLVIYWVGRKWIGLA